MTLFLYSFASVAIAFFIHLLVWRWKLPIYQTRALLKIFLGFYLCSIVIAINSPEISFIKNSQEFIQYSIFYISMMLSYIISYSALEADSPTLVMIQTIQKAGDEGISKDNFYQQMDNQTLLDPRINDLIRDKMLTLNHDIYQLTPKGHRFALIFVLYRKIFGLGLGG